MRCGYTRAYRFGTLVAGSGREAEQRVDLTFFFQGFESGDFVATPTLPPGQTAYLLLDTEPGVQYQWRVLTRATNEWVSSAVATFRGAVCVVDEP